MADDDRNDQQVVADLVEKQPICFLTTFGDHGKLVARPMTRKNSDFHGTLRLMAPRDGDVVREIRGNDTVNVTFSSSDGFVSLAATARELTDPHAVEEEWDAGVSAWFPNGPESATVVEVTAQSAQYWDTSGSSIAEVASFVTKAVTDNDDTPDMGSSNKVDL